MRPKSIAVLWGAWFINAISAQVCHFPTTNRLTGEEGTYLTSQKDTDVLLKNCTTINGTLYLDQEYEGTLVVSGIVNVTGRLVFYHSSVSDISWCDLESVLDLNVNNLTALQSISFPKLVSANRIQIHTDRDAQPIHVDFLALTKASSLEVVGQIASLEVQSLFNASYIAVGQGTPPVHHKPDAPGLNLSLPSLEYAGGLKLEGNFTNVSLPRLKTIASQSSGSSRITSNPALNVSLPSLTYAASLDLGCHSSVSLPLLEEVGHLIIRAENATDILLPSLWSATSISITGEVVNASFPALNETSKISITGYSKTEPNCTSSTLDWERTNTTKRTAEMNTCKNSSYSYHCPSYSCQWVDISPPKPPRKAPLSKAAVAGIATGSVIGFLALLYLLMWWRDWLPKRRFMQEEGEMEMDGVTVIGDGASGDRVEPARGVNGRRDSKDTIVMVVGVDERGEVGQRS